MTTLKERVTSYVNTVAHPKHYSGKIECIDCIESAVAELNGFEGFLAGNVIKYVFRFKRKNGKEDLQKAEWYLCKLMEMQEDNEQEDNENE